jgi:phosphohistidine swiveling domain-containing protein
MQNPIDLQIYINSRDLLYRGKRTPTLFSTKIKILAWSSGYQKEIGAGYKTVLINSLGEQYVDKENDAKIDAALHGRGMETAREYIDKMAELNKILLEKVEKGSGEDLTEAFASLLTYFFIVRSIIEPLYESFNSEDQSYIDAWRNDDSLFSSMDLHEKNLPADDPEKEWSLVLKDGELILAQEILRYEKKNSIASPINNEGRSNEIKGRIAFPGMVTGRARVVLSKTERDAVLEGEIIVAPMTTVDFISAMKKAAAFVTDEGGVTSHAAIVAREMKKPCIIATKIATKMIKTGDMIEVDAERGIVKITKN